MLTISEFLQENSFPAISLFENADNEAIHINGASVPLASMMVANRFLKSPQNILVIAKDYRSAEVWVENLESMVGEEFVRFFPSLGLKPYEIKVPFEGVLEERLKFFRDVSHTEKPFVVVCPLDAFLMKLPEPGEIMPECSGSADDYFLCLPSFGSRPVALSPAAFSSFGFSEGRNVGIFLMVLMTCSAEMRRVHSKWRSVPLWRGHHRKS